MIVFTTKLTRRKVVSAVLVICILISSCVVYFGDLKTSESVSISDEPEQSKQIIELRSNKDRVEYLQNFGWEVEEEPLETMEVRIPQDFNGVYGEYNELQKKQGFNLEKYSGKKVTRYTYKIKNYDENEEVIANLIIYKNKLIAGDVCSPKMGGFMHGLNESSQTSSENNTEKMSENIKEEQG